jgi:hypothetical protein
VVAEGRMRGDDGAVTSRDDPPVSDDDFPEFAAPPRHKPPVSEAAERDADARPDGNVQDEVDDVIARLRRERDERRP